MKKVFVLACVACMAAAAWGGPAGDAVPRGLAYQGVLNDPLTGPMTGPQSATFRIFADASGGDALWSAQQDIDCDSTGRFYAWLEGDDQLLDAFKEPQRLLEVQVAGHGDAIAPRMAFTAVPQAFLARYARQSPLAFAVAGALAVSNDLAVADAVQFDAGASFGDLEVDGNAAWQDADSPVQVSGTVEAESFAGDGIAPVNCIVMWMDPDHIPDGWVLCDGNNGTPNLVDRFPVGAGAGDVGNYQLLETGGADAVQLTTDQIPPHDHTYTTASQRNFHYWWASWGSSDWWQNSTGGACKNGSTDATGGNQPHENRPPYLAVCFIMRKN